MSDSATLELLKKIDQRLERLEKKVNEGPQIVTDGMSIFGDAVDEAFNPSSDKGLQNLEKLHKAQNILKQLSEDETIESMQTLIENIKHLSTVVDKLKQLDNGLSMTVDAFDEFFAAAMERGLKVDEFLSNLKKFTFLMADAFESGALSDLLESGILDPRSIETVGALGKSMAVSSSFNSSAGPGKVFTALLDKDVQRALGFGLNFAAHFGRKLDEKTIKIKG